MTEEEKDVNAWRHVNHSKKLDRILLVLILIWALLLFGLLDDHLHAAEWEVVSFNDAEHLAAQIGDIR